MEYEKRQSDIQEVVKHKSTVAIQEIAKPLFDFMGLNYFSYSRDFADKKSFTLENNNSVSEAWFKNFNPYCSQQLPNGVYLWDDVQKQSLISDLRELNFSNGIYIIKHQKTYTEIFGLSSAVNSVNVMQSYLNNMDTFNKFLMYFKDKASKIIEKSCTNAVIPCEFLLTNSQKPLIEYNKCNVERFKKSLHINRYYLSEELNGIKLTKRELYCLNEYIKGKSSLEIALHWGRNKAAVDSFLLNVKKKFHCKKSSELFEIFWKLGILKSNGYLDT